MPNYIVNNDFAGTKQAVSGSYKTLINLSAATATLKRFRIYDLLIGTNGTPADNSTEWTCNRSTAVGTSTAGTPLALDPADVASGTVCGLNSTVEPTYTALTQAVFYIAVNQRASYRWVAAPGSELVCAATNLNGITTSVKSASGYTGTASATNYYNE